MRYVIVIGEDETGGLLTGPMGGAIVYTEIAEASEVCKSILQGSLRESHPKFNAFVVKLIPVAMYMPIPAKDAAGDPYVDETILVPESEPKEQN